MTALWLLAAAWAQEAPDEVPPADEAPADEAPADEAPAEAPPDDDVAAREADLFGAPDDPPADDVTAREADLFGAPDDPAPDDASTADAPTSDRDQDALGGVLTTDRAIDARLAEADERLTIGGDLVLRTTLSIAEEGDATDGGLSAPNLLDLFADVRPDDRVRAYASARLSHDWTVRDGDTDWTGEPVEATTVTLDQLWLKTDIARRVYLTAGRQRIKWGTGRFWNPTDFLNLQTLDPLEVTDLRTGVALLKVHVPIGYAVNLYGVGNFEGAGALADVGGASRLEVAVGAAELSASIAARRDQPLRLGADLSAGLWLFDLHAEVAATNGLNVPYWEGTLDIATFTVPTEVDRSEDWILQAVAGADITVNLNDEDTLTVGGEAFYNDAGYDDPTLYPWLILEGQYTPFYLGKLYASAFALLPSPGRLDDTTFTASWIGNLSDGSNVVRLDWRQQVLTWISVDTWAMLHCGNNGELYYRLEIPAVPGVDGLEEGLTVPATVLDVGVWAQVSF